MNGPSIKCNTILLNKQVLTLPYNCLLMTLDVESMYTNINHTNESQAVLEIIGKYLVYASRDFNTQNHPLN